MVSIFCTCSAKIIHQSAALFGKIINTSLACSIDICVRRQIPFWGARRGRHDNKSIAQQAGTSNREFRTLRNLDVIINFQRHSHATALANQPRTAGHLSNSRAGQQDIGAFQQSAGIGETNREGVIGLETLAQPAELHEQRAYHRQSNKNKNADFEFQSSFVPIHFEVLLSISKRVSQG